MPLGKFPNDFLSFSTSSFPSRSFSGHAKESKVMEEMMKLFKSIDEEKLPQTQTPEIYIAIYDSPLKLFNPHNEVWILAK